LTTFWIAGIAFFAAHGIAAAAGGTWWGLHFFRYLDPPRILLALAAGALAVKALASHHRGAPPLPSIRWSVMVGLASFAVFWLLRDRLHFLGDGSVFLELEPKWSTWASREPLAHVLAIRIHALAGALGVSVERAFELWSCALGAVFVAVIAHADRSTESRGLLLAMVLSTAATQLFCGYIEHYPPFALVVVLLCLEWRHVVERRRPLLFTFLLFALALLLHVQAVLLIPALAWATWRQLQLRSSRGRAAALAELAGVAVLTVLAWGVVFRGIAGAPSIGEYLAILARADRYALGSTHDASSVAPPLLSLRHALDFLNLQLLLAPVAIGIVVTGIPRIGWRGLAQRTWEVALALAACAYIAAQFAFDPYLGAPRDWDVLSTGAFPLAFLAARLAPELQGGAGMGALAVGLAVVHALAFVLVNATPKAAVARFEELPLTAGQADFVMGTRALKAGDLEEAALRFRGIVEKMPYSTIGWFSLGLAYERQRDFERAREAFAKALAARQIDQRVPSADILERLGRAAMETGRFDEARRALGLALAERPDSPVAHQLLTMLDAREKERGE
jgi:Tfp pilus assembly protein PilF